MWRIIHRHRIPAQSLDEDHVLSCNDGDTEVITIQETTTLSMIVFVQILQEDEGLFLDLLLLLIIGLSLH